MQNDRRRVLVAGAAGLAALLVPEISQACFCSRRRRVRCEASSNLVPCEASVNGVPFSTCPVTWTLSKNPTIPDAPRITQSSPHNITVYGTNLAAWVQNGGVPIVGVADQNNPGSVIWGSYTSVGTVGSDGWTFSAVETGSTPGTPSSIIITVTLSLTGACRGTWMNQPVTYA
jgi:hypothetical protein